MRINQVAVLLAVGLALPAHAVDLSVVDVPDHGIQPQVATGTDGTLHLIYFKGEPAAGNLFYVQRRSGHSEFSDPIRINHADDAAIAMGTIRGAHLALGRDNRVHVAWMGSSRVAKPATREGAHPQSPMLYTRMNEEGDGFEPERNVMQWTTGLDGGGSIAADANGHVFVAWHGSGPDNREGENGRAVFVAVSRDDGQTFDREIQANPERTGSCGCCGMRAFVDRNDHLRLVYRAANDTSRDMSLLTSADHGGTFTLRRLNQWATQTCPMSSVFVADAQAELLVASEVEGYLELSRLDNVPSPVVNSERLSPLPAKHAAMAVNRRGESLVAWAEGAGWARGGTLKWRVFDAEGKAVGEVNGGDPLPTWSFPAVVAQGEGFLIVR